MYSPSHFPSEFLPPSKKREPEYGIAYARAAYNAFRGCGSGLFYNNSDRYAYLTELAQGRQSLDSLRKQLGYQSEASKKEDFAYIDPRILPYAQKYINYVQGKLRQLDHEVNVTAIDPVAEDAKRQYESRVRAYYQLRDWIEEVQLPAKELFADLELSELPQEPDEWLIEHTMNYQHRAAMEAEMRLKKLLTANKYEQVKKQKAFDISVYGAVITRTYHDKNGIPRIERIHPANFICSIVKDEFFSDMEYAGHIEYISVAQFIKESSPFLTESQIKDVIASKSTKAMNYIYGQSVYSVLNSAYDGLMHIPVMRFQFLTQDSELYAIKQNKFGNIYAQRTEMVDDEMCVTIPFGSSEDQIKNTYTAKYAGTWVIDSEVVYDYGRSPLLDGDLVEEKLDYHVVAPNMQDGVVVSLLSQMEEPLEMLNLAYIKAKQILADGFNGMLSIDISKLENIPMGKGGATMQPRAVLDLALKKKLLFYRSIRNRHDQVDGKPLEETPLGLELSDYLNQMRIAVEMLNEITGLNREAMQGQQSGDLVANTKFSYAATEIALDYLVVGMRESFTSECYSLLKLSQISERACRDKGTVSTLREVFGQNALLDGTVSFHQYALTLAPKPTIEEWQRFYISVDKALTAGLITFADAIFVYRIDNLKQAEQVLIQRQRKQERTLAAQKQADIEANAQVQQQSAQMAAEQQLQLINAKGMWSYQIEELRVRGKEMDTARKSAIQRQIQAEANQTKLLNTRIAGSNEVVKQALRNKVEYEKVDKRPDRSPED